MELLIVDDDKVDRTHIKRSLTRSDTLCNVTEVENVNAALDLLQGTAFDAILLDYNMPQRNGLELLHEVRNKNITNDSAIIMMSTSEEEELAMECLQAGAQDFIAKSDITGYRLRRAILGAKARFEMEQKLQDSYSKVKQLAEQDDLTKLANRYMFDEFLKESIARNKRQNYKVALILFDLDHFKFVNDTHGHDIGDKLLKKSVNRIRTCLRDEDLFCRLGGDEFAIILSQIDHVEIAEKVSKRILKVMEKPFDFEVAVINMSASIGISIYPDSAKNATEIFKRADMAMYKAKNLGRNQLAFFEDEMQKQFLSRYQIESDLKKAITKKELKLHYQPIYSGSNDIIKGFEALIRWNKGNISIPPSDFIPVAEESKLINPIGRWVIEESFSQIAKWRKKSDLDLSISVNLSPVQLLDKELVLHIKDCLKKHQLESKLIEFELTETALLDDSKNTKKIINEISHLGCKIALDDFGTGFSSISHLNNFPIDIVKIDRSLMPIDNKNDFNHRLMRGLVAMLQNLEFDIVAEGVEYQSHLELCKSLKIQRLQGFYLSKPMSPDEIIKQNILVKRSDSVSNITSINKNI